MSDSFKLLCTNDFAGSWDPVPSSNSWLPGGRALRDTVDRLRSDGAALWVDAGDLVDGGPIAAADDGATAWQAAATLGIDIAVPGNHEFDWGIARFQKLATVSGMKYLCANAKLGLPSTSLVDTPAGVVGILGVTYPEMDKLSQEFADAGLVPVDDVVVDSARALRRDGAEFVVTVVHNGVAGEDLAFLGDWYRHVDAVVGGHTLWRWMGHHGETAICQPAAYGAEIGVIEFRKGRRPEVRGVVVEKGGRWDGPGAEHLDRARDEVIGTVRQDISSTLGRPNDLLDRLAQSMAAVTEADGAIVSLWDCFVTQPIDGRIVSYLREGSLTLADVLRFSPHAYDPVTTIDLTKAEYQQAQRALTIPFLDTLGTFESSGTAADTMCVALTQRQAELVSAETARAAPARTSDHRGPVLLDVWRELFPITRAADLGQAASR